MPPALSLMGPKPSMVKPQLRVASMPRAARAIPYLAWHRQSQCFSPPARWGLLDFMSVASSSCLPPACLLPPRRPSAASCLLPPPAASCLVLLLFGNCDPQCSLPDLNHDHPRPVFPAGPQPRPATPSVPCRTSTTTIPAQCSLPDLNREYPRQVFPAGPQPRPSTPSVPCRTSTASIHAKCSLPDLM